MPFILSKVSTPMTETQEKEIKTRLGQAISLIPGKSEEYLFLCVEDQCRLWLRGDNGRPMGYLTVSIFGNESHTRYRDSFRTMQVPPSMAGLLFLVRLCV